MMEDERLKMKDERLIYPKIRIIQKILIIQKIQKIQTNSL